MSLINQTEPRDIYEEDECIALVATIVSKVIEQAYEEVCAEESEKYLKKREVRLELHVALIKNA